MKEPIEMGGSKVVAITSRFAKEALWVRAAGGWVEAASKAAVTCRVDLHLARMST